MRVTEPLLDTKKVDPPPPRTPSMHSSSKSSHRTFFRNRRRSKVVLPRMVDRNLPFHQSRNSMNVRNAYDRPLYQLLVNDWFHALLRVPPCLSVNFLLSIWVLMVLMFAVLYWYLDTVHYKIIDCGLGPTEGVTIAFQGAFAFSLETCTTVGYGLPGTSTSFFEKGCNAVQFTIFVQMLWSMMFNAFLFAFFYSLLSKSEFRSSQIIFTRKLLINVDQTEERAYVRLQCYDIDSAHPLVEAHARMYFLDHKLKMHPLRLMDPNDDLGGMLYPSVPTDIVHHIDHHSPLSPIKLPFIERSNGLALRSIDSYTGNRDEIICPVCGEAYGTYARLRKHVEYNAMLEEGYPKEKSHAGFEFPSIPTLTLELVREHIEKTLSEIIVVVEAIDPQLSGTFQSLQSYKYEDIVFGAEFGNCMSTDVCGKEFLVDMRQFHKTRRVRHPGSPSSLSFHPSDQRSKSLDEQDCEGDSNDEEHDDDDGDGDDDEMSVEHGGTYFRRSYNTFSSFRNPSQGNGVLSNLLTGIQFSRAQHQRREPSMLTVDDEDDDETITNDEQRIFPKRMSSSHMVV